MDAGGFLTEPALRPADGTILRRAAADGVGLRLGIWPRADARGTVLMFTGRTEYIEKYGPAAIDFAARGYASATLDWRGQGRSDRLIADPLLGHVGHFRDYQADVAVLLAQAAAADLPRPWFLLAHSMGGAIGLRALIEGLPVAAAVFSGPMWGFNVSPPLKALAWGVGGAATLVGLGARGAPGTGVDNYVSATPVPGNGLTTDPEMYAFMVRMLDQNPGLGVGRPTCGWVFEALRECRALARAPLPALPVLITLGDGEEVVSPTAVEAMAARWPTAELRRFAACRHEIMMETEALRTAFYDACAAHFQRAG